MSDYPPKRLLIIYHSQSGRAEQLALACFFAAQKEESVITELQCAHDVDARQILSANALLLITPENFGALSGSMKELFDRVYYPLQRAGFSGIPYALIITAGNDGCGCERQIERILKGLAAKKIQETQIVYGEPAAADCLACEELALAIATGLSLGVF